MIVREEPDGSLVLINQEDHARASGLMAAHWGNKDFMRPEPFTPFVRAATWHDCGWRRYETAPIFDVSKKAPPTFHNVPTDDAQLDAYQDGIDWLRRLDDYAGTLISAHRTGLWQSRYDFIASPPMRGGRTLSPGVVALIAREEARQKAALAHYDRAQFQVNYQLLQIVDLLSLYLCTAKPKAERIDFAPVNYGGDGKSGAPLTLTPRDETRIVVDPFPFDTRPLTVNVVYKRLVRRDFTSNEAFREHYFGLAPQVQTFVFE